MELLVDAQGFSGAFNEFIVKELAFISLTKLEDDEKEKIPSVKFFRPPTSEFSDFVQKNRTNTWLERNYHGIPWNYGALEYDQVRDVLKAEAKNVSRIYVKGAQKKEWLKAYFGNQLLPVIIDLEECFEDCPSISTFKNMPSFMCSYHCNVKNKICAVKNVVLLKKWLEKKIIRSTDRSIRLYFELGSLNRMSREDIAYLPFSFLSTFAARQVEGAWEKLTDAMQLDDGIMSCRYCLKHYNISDECHVDGPPPMIKDCTRCNN